MKGKTGDAWLGVYVRESCKALSSWHFSVSVLDDCFIDFRPQLGANMASEIVQTP